MTVCTDWNLLGSPMQKKCRWCCSVSDYSPLTLSGVCDYSVEASGLVLFASCVSPLSGHARALRTRVRLASLTLATLSRQRFSRLSLVSGSLSTLSRQRRSLLVPRLLYLELSLVELASSSFFFFAPLYSAPLASARLWLSHLQKQFRVRNIINF